MIETIIKPYERGLVMVWNGIVVTTASPGKFVIPDTHYRGVAYGKPWPLESLEEDEISICTDLLKIINDITMRYNPDGTYPPAVIPDISVIDKYVRCCCANSLSTRVLLCATTSPYPRMDERNAKALAAKGQLLGYDYILSGCDFSAVNNDFYPPIPDSLASFALKMNNNGLFSSMSDLEKYIDSRWAYIREAGEKFVEKEGYLIRETPLEDSGCFWPCEVWELEW